MRSAGIGPRLAITNQKQKANAAWRRRQEAGVPRIAGGMGNGTATAGGSMDGPQNLNSEWSYDPAVACLGTCPKALKVRPRRDLHARGHNVIHNS